MNRANLHNLTKGTRPTLHAAEPNWNTLKGIVERAAQSIIDAQNKENGLATRFAAAYSAAFWLARVALEASGYRLAGADGHRVTVFQTLAQTLEWNNAQWRTLDDLHKLRNRFDYGDIVAIPEGHIETAIAGAQALLDDVLRFFPATRPETPA